MPAQLKRRLLIFFTLVLLVALAFPAHWYFKGRFYESTDNAYVQGEITRISSQLGARIDNVPVEDNQHVTKGELPVHRNGPISNWPSSAPGQPWPPAKPNVSRRKAG